MKIFNTLTREIEEFKPRSDKEVNMYVCGPTVYDYCHIGHARTWIAFDMIVRYLRHRGYQVRYIVNITDIDDKIIQRANETGEDPLRLAQEFELAFHKDLKALGLLRADKYPKVSEHIVEIIEMIRTLISQGFAYESDGDVYFDITRVSDYGKLSNQSLREMQIGTRIELDKKKNPADFALWKSTKEGEPSWESPWGNGRPGWHIECSAMSSKHLGNEIDIHGGGRDLIFPHHENEIAQSEAYSKKKPFVKYWIHTGFLTINGEKMSKSLGNFITIRELLKKVDPEVFKLMVLSTHYRSPIDYNERTLHQSSSRLKRIYNTIESLQWKTSAEKADHIPASRETIPEIEKAKQMFYTAMDDDLNTSRAIASLFQLVRAANKAIENEVPTWQLNEYAKTLRELGGVLGLLQKSKERQEPPEKARELIKLREDARRNGDWEKADAIREELNKIGVLIEDTPEGTKWRLKD